MAHFVTDNDDDDTVSVRYATKTIAPSGTSSSEARSSIERKINEGCHLWRRTKCSVARNIKLSLRIDKEAAGVAIIVIRHYFRSITGNGQHAEIAHRINNQFISFREILYSLLRWN